MRWAADKQRQLHDMRSPYEKLKEYLQKQEYLKEKTAGFIAGNFLYFASESIMGTLFLVKRTSYVDVMLYYIFFATMSILAADYITQRLIDRAKAKDQKLNESVQAYGILG